MTEAKKEFEQSIKALRKEFGRYDPTNSCGTFAKLAERFKKRASDEPLFRGKDRQEVFGYKLEAVKELGKGLEDYLFKQPFLSKFFRRRTNKQEARKILDMLKDTKITKACLVLKNTNR